jgi:formylglycine-generating enzyme
MVLSRLRRFPLAAITDASRSVLGVAVGLVLVCGVLVCQVLGCGRARSAPDDGTSSVGSPTPAGAGAAIASSATAAPSSEPAPVGREAPSPPVSTAFDDDLRAAVVYHPGKLTWHKVRKVNWRAEPAPDATPLPPEPARSAGVCRAGMVPVQGRFLLDRRGRADTDEVQLEQNAVCSFFRTDDKGINGLCDRFDAEKWAARIASFPRRELSFCIDRYEFPNRYGEYPLVVTTYAEAAGYCAREGKRLCTESEWTFACEGEEARPYPYGFERDNRACAIDRFGPAPGRDTFRPRMTEATAKGLDLAFLASRSGEVATCTSPFGVADMTGNVDEWTRTVRRYGYEMIMMGGHWGPARQRCRPQTRGHGPQYVRYDQGFRCCEDLPAARPGP